MNSNGGTPEWADSEPWRDEYDDMEADLDEWDRAGSSQAGPSVDDFFRPGGLLAERLPKWEDRSGQWEMATAVATALGSKRNLVVEAGTGTGKTLAYLVPLILTGKRSVVSTGTKNLQEQLMHKDVPMVREVLGGHLQVALMKGRNNFLCLQKLAEQENNPQLDGVADLTEFRVIQEWAGKTQTGDRSELRDLPASSKLWPQLDARREACTGKECERFEDCFITRMHQRAREADLIVVNHHLFFADLALGRDDFGAIIPPHQAVVFDEAHEIEGVVGSFFGVSLSNLQIDELVRDVQAIAKRDKFGSKQLDTGLTQLRSIVNRFFALFKEFDSRQIFEDRAGFRRQHAETYGQLNGALSGLASRLSLVKDKTDEAEALAKRCALLSLTLRALMGDSQLDLAEANGHPALTLLIEDQLGNFVYWVEKRGKSVLLHATPIHVASILEETLYRRDTVAVMTSATLAVDGSFDYVRGRLGVSASEDLIVPGHFNYREQALLYIPRRMPAPNSEEYARRAADQIIELLRLSQGRAFVLFTSYQQMRRMHLHVSNAVEYPCVMQGEAPNAAILEAFRNTKHCVLFATMSFWQGVDVPGEQLSCVIIDKLPFAVPNDPIVAARIDQIRQYGGNPFFEYQIPAAALALKQGFGRLIRTSSDRGVLALLDSRIVTKPYGETFLNSLPDYARTRSLDDVAQFFGR